MDRQEPAFPCGDPAEYWRFFVGQTRSIARRKLSFQCVEIQPDSIRGILTLDGRPVAGELHLDMPVVVIRDTTTGQPLVAMVLRAVSPALDAADVQVCARGQILTANA
jgi:hypothetical protein